MTKRLGILAGSGELPRLVAEAARSKGYNIHMIGFRGISDASVIEAYVHDWTKLAAVGATYKALRTARVEEVLLIGKITRPSLSQLIPDMRGVRLLAKLKNTKGDDALLRAIAEDIESEGFRIVGAHDVAPHLVAPKGSIIGKAPDKEAQADIARGFGVIETIGDLDIGQAAVVQQGIVLGIEAIEGTDALITRCGNLKRAGRGPILIKRAKPNQDLRFDMPAIGDKTLHLCNEAGFSGIAVEAGKTLINISQPPHNNKIFLYGQSECHGSS